MKNNSYTIKVNLKSNPYKVLIEKGSIKLIGSELIRLGIKKSTKILVVSNPVVANHYGDLVLGKLKESGFEANLLIIEAGEDKKNQASISLIHDSAYENNLERTSLMIALGGGVIGDMTGFAASTWLRGISFIQIPTTLLSMVDASVGGKTGINHPQGKNLIGAFHQPKLVLIDTKTLNTLPSREFKAGMAEVIKYGVIVDKELFKKLEDADCIDNLKLIPDDLLLDIIYHSVQAKALIVEKDELEGGLRAILNYGHTFGHAIEALSGYEQWVHGEAVAIGMIAIGELAIKKKFWTIKENTRQQDLLLKAGLPISWPNLDIDKVINALKSDKKVREGNIRFVMPLSIGNVKIVDSISIKELYDFLSELNNL